MRLFDYQSNIVTRTRQAYRTGARAPLIVSPTGSGKTVIFAYITKSVSSRNKRVMILCHRAELVDQISRALTEQSVSHGIIAAGHRMNTRAAVQVASVFTLVRRLDRLPPPDLLIIDEAHHCALTTTWGDITKAYSSAKLLGVTATPTRLSGEGLGDIFDTMILGPTTQELINQGALSPLRVFAPATIDLSLLHTRGGDYARNELAAEFNKPTITGDAISHYRNLASGRAAVAFCVSIEHAKDVSAGFRAAGYSSIAIDGKMDRGLRANIVRDFADGKIQILTSCDLISEGFDCPRIEVGISLRPTQSLGLWIQQCGRILRTWPGKTEAILLDHAGNSRIHGLPTDDRNWSLNGRMVKIRNTADSEPPCRICPQCYAATRSPTAKCSNCGASFPIESREISHVEGELVEVKSRPSKPRDPTKTAARVEQGRTDSVEALTELGIRRGMHPAKAVHWAGYVWAGRQAKLRKTA